MVLNCFGNIAMTRPIRASDKFEAKIGNHKSRFNLGLTFWFLLIMWNNSCRSINISVAVRGNVNDLCKDWFVQKVGWNNVAEWTNCRRSGRCQMIYTPQFASTYPLCALRLSVTIFTPCIIDDKTCSLFKAHLLYRVEYLWALLGLKLVNL